MAKILLADDSTHAQRMGTKILSAEGHEVTTVSNGQAAIKMLDEFIPDLIVADIFMPGKSGYELCQAVKSSPKWNHIPVLLTIGAMEPYDPAEGRKARADGLITKPLESSDLVATTEKLLASAKPAPPPAVVQPPPEEPTLAELPEEEEIPDEMMQGAARKKWEMPEEVSDQPVALFNDLLGHAEGPQTDVVENSATDHPVAAEEQTLVQDFLADRPETREMQTLQTPPFEESQTQEEVVWTAEPAPVTEEDEKLLAPASDWGTLQKMVEEENEGQPAILSGAGMLQAGTPLASIPEEAPAEGTFAALLAALPEQEEQALTSEVETSTVPPSLVPQSSEGSQPTVAPLDLLTIEQLVRDAVEEMMPQIVDRIARTIKHSIQQEP